MSHCEGAPMAIDGYSPYEWPDLRKVCPCHDDFIIWMIYDNIFSSMIYIHFLLKELLVKKEDVNKRVMSCPHGGVEQMPLQL